MARRDVHPGQRYQKVDGSSIWVVVELTTDGEGIVHARVTRFGDSTTVKMLSVSALRDARMYKLLDA